MGKPLNIVFMGTASFAIPSLKILLDKGHHMKAVVTAPDKPVGRGQKIKYSPVKEFALAQNLHLLQPLRLNDPSFIEELKILRPDLQIVVAFRMLPKAVWEIPPMGTINLHSSLLPQYRGAAPINHALINGEIQTGVSTFFIDEKIDTGEIIAQQKTGIPTNETAGELHDRLMLMGADLISSTIDLIRNKDYKAINQNTLIDPQASLKPAPKIFKNDCRINWQQPVALIHNFIRGLSPYPGAFCFFVLHDGSRKMIKIFRALLPKDEISFTESNFSSDGRTNFFVKGNDDCISILEVQMEGKKKMNIADFLRGFKVESIKMLD